MLLQIKCVIIFHSLGECVTQLEIEFKYNAEINSAQAGVCIFSKADVSILKTEYLSFGRNSKVIGTSHESEARSFSAKDNSVNV